MCTLQFHTFTVYQANGRFLMWLEKGEDLEGEQREGRRKGKA